MTNGEKFINDYYPNSSITRDSLTGRVFVNEDNADFTLPIEWWNSEYKEPTTKNDLGVDNQNIRLIDANALIERLRPKHFDWWGEGEQDDFGKGNNSMLEEVIEAIEEFPSVTPQPCEDAVSRQAVLELIADYDLSMGQMVRGIHALPSVTPQEPRKGHWIVQPSNKEQGERDFIWWKCSECGQVIFSETEKDRKEFHAFCGRCGADMREVEE